MLFMKKSKNDVEQQQFGSTQKYLEIDQIKDDVLILRDGSLRSVLKVSSINMSLLSETEQTSIIGAYQNALNSLEFPVQFLAQSRKVDLTSYMAILQKAADAQPPGLLKDQTLEYISFLKQILVNVNVMDKVFFIVVPFYPNVVATQSKGLLSKFGFGGVPANNTNEASKDYENNRKQLEQRSEIVSSLFGSMGLSVEAMPTEALIEIFYTCYNPETAGHEHLKDIGSMGAKYISARQDVEQNLGGTRQ